MSDSDLELETFETIQLNDPDEEPPLPWNYEEYRSPFTSHIHYSCGHQVLIEQLDDEQLISKKCPICQNDQSPLSVIQKKHLKCPQLYSENISGKIKEMGEDPTIRNRKSGVHEYYLNQQRLLQKYGSDLQNVPVKRNYITKHDPANFMPQIDSQIENSTISQVVQETELTDPTEPTEKSQEVLLKMKEQRRKTIQTKAKEKEQKITDLQLWISFITNFVLVILKSIAVSVSSSATVVASLMDSILDILSCFTVIFTERFSRKKSFNDLYRYPVGKSRMEPILILVFSSVTSTMGIQLFIQSIQHLIGKKTKVEFGVYPFVVLLFTVGVKLILYIWCRFSKRSVIRILSKDHRNDVFSNLVGVIMAEMATKYYWRMDFIGEMTIAFMILLTWITLIYKNIFNLIGVSAPPELFNRLTFLALKHHQAILAVERVQTLKFGSKYFVEIDIVLPYDMLLEQCHRIGESLQDKVEEIPEVERAFVHVDSQIEHKPEHN
ncbi:metal tolerance protein c3-related [Anaeramoeba ignava]|uniref:Metal tolerance protein c3-related n=1 Tax=Anaeramoeba ignava TaxID=1746090 RepID=A0A9Q0LLE3_ANAIG|nr:metal tolerance protein c3-related [Anaeramoeba ignava]